MDKRYDDESAPHRPFKAGLIVASNYRFEFWYEFETILAHMPRRDNVSPSQLLDSNFRPRSSFFGFAGTDHSSTF
jgi:hypothetical protein